MMKHFILLALVALSACTDPMLSAEMAIGTNGVSVNPTLSGQVGDATVSIQP
jgi:type 1 fimbria pilin